MDQHLSRDALLEKLRVEYERLWTTFTRLTPEQMVTPGVLGDWSVKDMLAHLIFWNYYAVSELQSALENRPFEFDHDIDHNAEVVERYREQSWIDVLVGFASSYKEVEALIKSLPDDAFEPGSALEKVLGESVTQALNNNTYDHYALHESELRAWMEQAGIS